MSHTRESRDLNANAIEAFIRIGLIALLVAWCFLILEPFLMPTLWGIIIAVTVYPAYEWIEVKLRHSRKIAASIVVAGLLFLVLIAGALLVESLVVGISRARESMQGDSISIPPVPDAILTIPLAGKAIAELWNLARTNLDAVLVQIAPQLKGLALWLMGSVADVGKAVLMFVLSTIIAGIFLATSEAGGRAAREIGSRIIAGRGDEFVKDALLTIRSVVRGILGVALIQAVMAGSGFAVAGVPYAGVWALLCMILAVVQIGIGPVAIPVAIYMFYATDTLTAGLLAVWLLLTLVIDNILKPILLGRKAPVPMLVIFLGAIGGFLLSGIVGLFVGAVVLSLGYKLFLAWLKEGTEGESVQP